MFPDMGDKTVISIVLQNILKTISDGDLLDRQRCLMLNGSLIFFFLPQSAVYSFNYWI